MATVVVGAGLEGDRFGCWVGARVVLAAVAGLTAVEALLAEPVVVDVAECDERPPQPPAPSANIRNPAAMRRRALIGPTVAKRR